MGSHRLLEHTADMGIEAEGETMETLFIEAARGLREMIFAGSRAAPRELRAVEIEGGDPGELLVAWLNEILFLFETRGFVPAEFAINELSEGRLRGEVRGEIYDRERHTVEREVKSVTYHQLRIDRAEDGWRTRLYVDL